MTVQMIESFENSFVGTPPIPDGWAEMPVAVDNNGWSQSDFNVTDGQKSAEFNGHGISGGNYCGGIIKDGVDLSAAKKIEMDYAIISRSGTYVADTDLNLRIGDTGVVTSIAKVGTSAPSSGTFVYDFEVDPLGLKSKYDFTNMRIMIDGPVAYMNGNIKYRIDALRIIV